MRFTNWSALSGGSPSPVVDTMKTTGAASSSKLYWKRSHDPLGDSCIAKSALKRNNAVIQALLHICAAVSIQCTQSRVVMMVCFLAGGRSYLCICVQAAQLGNQSVLLGHLSYPFGYRLGLALLRPVQKHESWLLPTGHAGGYERYQRH